MQVLPALDFVLLYVSDIEASYQYFTETLGLSSDTAQNGPNFRYLKGGKGVDMGLNRVSEDTPQAGTVELYFKTKDLEGLHSVLADKGAVVTPIVARPFASIFNVSAPDELNVVMMGS